MVETRPLLLKEVREILRMSAIKVAKIVNKSNTTVYSHELMSTEKSAEIIRKLRYSRGESQEDFAYRLRAPVKSVQMMEWDDRRSPWQRVLDAMAELNDWSGAQMATVFPTSRSTMSRWRNAGMFPTSDQIAKARLELNKLRSRFPDDDEYYKLQSLLEEVVSSEDSFRV